MLKNHPLTLEKSHICNDRLTGRVLNNNKPASQLYEGSEARFRIDNPSSCC